MKKAPADRPRTCWPDRPILKTTGAGRKWSKNMSKQAIYTMIIVALLAVALAACGGCAATPS